MSETEQITDGLNLSQLEAVTHKGGPLLIVAGAGTGKTTVVTKKIAWLIEQKLAEPSEILALTFTDKAATEMEERVDRLLPYGYVDVEIATFHSFCEKILRGYGLDAGLPANFKLLKPTQQWLMIRQNLDSFNLDYYRPLGNPTKFIHALLKHFSRAKDEEIYPEDYVAYAQERRLNLDSPDFVGTKDEEGHEAKRIGEIAAAYHRYQQLLFDNSYLDFGDLIVQALRLFRQRPNVLGKIRKKYKYILVDEFQDTNVAQYDLVKLLAAPTNNLTVVGDEDQSIYKFRGASFSNILKFRDDFPQATKIFLTENYRSLQGILDTSYSFIQNNNPNRLEIKLSEDGLSLSKKLVASREGEALIKHYPFADLHAEAEGVRQLIAEHMAADANLTLDDFAILGRSHDSLVPFINLFEEKQIPYIYFANKGLYYKSIIQDIIAYCKLLDNYHESEALYRVLNFKLFAIQPEALVEIGGHAKKKSLSLFEALREAAAIKGMDQQSLAGITKLLAFLDIHSALARTSSAEKVFIQIVNDLELGTPSLEEDPNGRYFQAFHRVIRDFQSESTDKSMKTFTKKVAYEMEAGEQGELEIDLDAGPHAIKLMTVHAAKGLEYPYVFVVGLVDKRFPTIERKEEIELPDALVKDIVPEGDFHLQEERRLFYVAMTRARDGLYLTRALDTGGKLTKKPSRFLIEIGLAEEEKSQPTGELELAYKEPRFALPIPKSFSFSQLSTFKKCPLEYKYRQILGIPGPGSGALSFGQSMHKTLEKFVLETKPGEQTADLFGGEVSSGKLPSFAELKKLYEHSWIDEWYDSKDHMEKYRQQGLDMLRDFYEQCEKLPPKPKYIEKSFTMNVGKYSFRGKIDRADETPEGLVIVDYKTGKAPKAGKLDKDNKKQLLIYQWAAQDFLREKVADLQYWFLLNGLSVESFIGNNDDIEQMKEELLATIEDIVTCAKNDAFYERDLDIAHDCEFRHLEERARATHG